MASSFFRQAISRTAPAPAVAVARYDVFLSHRRVDTKRSVVRLLHDRLTQQHNLRSFLDDTSLKPGDLLMESIRDAVADCRVGVAIFSPRYCSSEFCLWELAMMVEARKRIVPVFYNVKPSQLCVPRVAIDAGVYLPEDVERLNAALEVAKYTVGIVFNSRSGDMAELVARTAHSVLDNMGIFGKELNTQM